MLHILIYLLKCFRDVEKVNESALEKLKSRVMETNSSFSNTLSLFESKNKEYLETQNKLSGNYWNFLFQILNVTRKSWVFLLLWSTS